jgi:hypothetical protein
MGLGYSKVEPDRSSEVGSAVAWCGEENRIRLARQFQRTDGVWQRFSLCSRIPTLPVFPAQIFISLCHIGDLLRLPVVK